MPPGQLQLSKSLQLASKVLRADPHELSMHEAHADVVSWLRQAVYAPPPLLLLLLHAAKRTAQPPRTAADKTFVMDMVGLPSPKERSPERHTDRSASHILPPLASQASLSPWKGFPAAFSARALAHSGGSTLAPPLLLPLLPPGFG